jgi:hypothetical protein
MHLKNKRNIIIIQFIFCITCTYNNELRNELIEMARIDQSVRKENAFVETDDIHDHEAMMHEQIKQIDNKNTGRLKEIVNKHGWPDYKLVGRDGSHAAWLVLQHSEDLQFQKHCLVLIEDAMRKGQVSKSNYAYLLDRILIREGKKQVYGTQFQIDGNIMVPFSIENEENVDERRKTMGLPCLEEYRKQLN